MNTPEDKSQDEEPIQNLVDPLPPRSAVNSKIDPRIATKEGPSIAGYEIIARLGVGGMGVVWKAMQLSTRRVVAIKFMHPSATASESLRRRFDREVEMVGRLEHPGIARVYDSGYQRGHYYFAMELVNGLPLDTFIKRKALHARQILLLMAAICDAMQHAHQRGVIHRDLKPSNILIDEQGCPHILDFGLGKIVDANVSNDVLTLPDHWAGTPAYMSPEQASGKANTDTRSDVYSLGVILYQLLLGRYPHDVTGPHLSVLNRILDEEIVRPRSVVRGLDGEVEALLLKALAKHPDDRYSSAGAFGEDIKHYLDGDPLTARQPTAFYFLKKKAKKYRVRFGVASAIVLGLLSADIYGSMRISEQRNLAVSAAKEQHDEKLLADLRYADGLASWGDSLSDQEQWTRSKDIYWQARQIQLDQGKPATAADLGLFDAYEKSPPPLSVFPGNETGTRPTIATVSITSDGRNVRRAARDGTIRVYDLLIAKEVAQVGSPLVNALVLNAAFTADGQYLLRYVSSEKIEKSPRYWLEKVNARDGSVLKQITLAGPSRVPPTFSTDGKFAVISARSDARDALSRPVLLLADLQNGSPPSTLVRDASTIKAVAFSPNSKTLACYGSDREITFWDVTTGKVLQSEPLPHGSEADWLKGTPTIVFAGEQIGLLASFEYQSIGFLNLGKNTTAKTFDVSSRPVRALAVSGDGKSAISADDIGDVKLSSTQTGRTLREFKAENQVVSASFSPDGRRVLTTDKCGTIEAWLGAVNDLPVFRHHTAEPRYFAFSPDGQLGAALQSNEIEVYDLVSHCRLRAIRAAGNVVSIGFTQDSHWLAAATDTGEVNRFEVFGDQQIRSCREGAALQAIPGVDPAISTALCESTLLSNNAQTALSLTARGTILMDVIHGIPMRVLDSDTDSLGIVSADGTKALLVHGASVPSIKLCDTGAGTVQTLPFDAARFVTCACLSPDNAIAYFGRDDGIIDAVNMRSGQLEWEAMGHERAVRCVQVTPDGGTLLSGSDDGTLRCWDTRQGRELHTLVNGLEAITAVALSSDARRIWCNGGDGNSYLWDLSRSLKLQNGGKNAEDARKILVKAPKDQLAIEFLADWYALNGSVDWSCNLLDQLTASVGFTLASARYRWRNGDFEAAAADFDAALNRETDPDRQDYLRACRDAAKRGDH